MLVPLYGALGLSSYWQFIDIKFPVDEIIRFYVEDYGEETVTTISQTRKLRDCPTSGVEYYLDGGKNVRWPLLSHTGYQRGTGENIYINRMDWPHTAKTGQYRVCQTLRFRCNPIRDHLLSVCTDVFEVE